MHKSHIYNISPAYTMVQISHVTLCTFNLKSKIFNLQFEIRIGNTFISVGMTAAQGVNSVNKIVIKVTSSEPTTSPSHSSLLSKFRWYLKKSLSAGKRHLTFYTWWEFVSNIHSLSTRSSSSVWSKHSVKKRQTNKLLTNFIPLVI